MNLLLEVALHLENVCTLFTRPGLLHYYGWDGMHVYREACERKRRKMALYRLRRNRLLKTKIIAGKLLVALTEQGINQVLRQRILLAPETEGEELCLVTFDIPEVQRKARVAMRCFLKGIGFERIHLSVWASKKHVASDLATLLKRMRKDRWVRIYEAKEQI